MKRILAAILSILMIVSIFPLGVFAADENNTSSQPTTSVDTSDVEIGGGLGTIISNSLEEDEATTEEEDANIENKILEVTMEEDMAHVEFNNNVECKIIVGLYDENTGAMLCSGIEENIEPHMGGIYIAIDTETMPEFYIVRAFLLDMNNVALHKSYENTHYTTEFQEFLAKTTDDFEEETVLNLDSNKENNFAVFAEGTITITESEYNILESADEENFVYTFSNVNEEITSLKNGDAVYFENDETFVIFKVDTVTVDGTTATITGQEDIALDEFFSYVKIDSTIPEEDEVATYGLLDDGINESFDVFEKNFKIDEKLSNNVTLKVDGELSIKAVLKIFYENKNLEVYVGLHEKATFNFDLTGKYPRYEYSFGEIPVAKFFGGVVKISLEAAFVFEFSASVNASAVQVATIGFAFDTNSMLIQNKSVPPTLDWDAKIEGELYLGFALRPSVDAVWGLVEAGLTCDFGVKITGEILYSSDEDVKHSCAVCLNGDIYGVLGFDVFLDSFVLKKPLEHKFKPFTTHLCDFYWSNELGFHFGDCPNISYKVSLLVIDGNGNPVPGVSANDDITNEKGIVELGYLSKKRYTLTLEKDTFEKEYSIDVDMAGMKTVVFKYVDSDNIKYTDELYFEYEINDGEAIITGFDKSFIGDVIIPETLGGYPVVDIGFEAFGWCNGISNIKIPLNVRNICNYAFANCDNLKSVEISDTVTSVGAWCFTNCTSLTNIVIPKNVTMIGSYAFNGCTNLSRIDVSEENTEFISVDGIVYRENGTQIYIYPCGILSKNFNIPDNINTIGYGAFYNCDNLISVNIPDSVTVIENQAFCNCSSLESVNLSNNITSISGSVFEGCIKLTSISIPESVTNIGYHAFLWCEALTGVTMANNVESIETEAFYGCNNLKNIYFKGSKANYDSITISLGNENFTNAKTHYYSDKNEFTDESYFTYKVSDGVVTITGFESSFFGVVNIPETLGGYSVEVIGKSSFENCNKITNVIIPNSVTTIENYVFYDCSSLNSIIIPNSVKSIGVSAFAGCVNLTQISIPESVTSIGTYAFDYCPNLLCIDVAENNTVYTSVDNVLFTEDMTSLICYAASKTNTEYVIPNSVTKITSNAFAYCKNLKTVIISDNVSIISTPAFDYCVNLTQIEVTQNNNSYTSVNGVLFTKDETRIIRYPEGKNDDEYIVPEGVTKFTTHAFYGCENLNCITINDDVTSIPDLTFARCSNLSSIVIPCAVIRIRDYAFYNCPDIKNVYYTGSQTQWNGISVGIENTAILNATIHYNYIPSEMVAYASYAPENVYTNDYEFTSFITEYDLVPGAVYTLMILRSEGDLTTDNLIYITDTVADEAGTAEFSYVCETPSDEFSIIVTGPCNHAVSDWITVYEPTSSDVGVQVKICSKCDMIIEQEEISIIPVLSGDANDDGKINLTDVATILKYIAKWNVTLHFTVADVNCDGRVNLLDASLILKYIAKWDVVLGK